MDTAFKRSYSVLLAYLLVLSAGLLIQFFYTQEQISVGINHLHNPIADFFFRYFTYAGDGIFCVVLSLIVLIKDRKAGIILLACYIISSLITQGFKHWVFDDMMRPSVVLKHLELYYVPGVEIHQYNSFPSGHSTSAFAMGTMLALLAKKNWVRLIVLALTLLVGFSRIYLLQHFYQDVLAGSVIGFSTSYTLYLFLYKNDKSQIKTAG